MKEIFSKNKLKEYSILALAFLGDALHTFFIREHVIRQNNLKPENYHILSSKFCRAKSQAIVFDKLIDNFNEEEKEIALRARNHKSRVAKNANLEDYKKATAFEAILGYLYLTGQEKRLEEILEKSIK